MKATITLAAEDSTIMWLAHSQTLLLLLADDAAYMGERGPADFGPAPKVDPDPPIDPETGEILEG